MEELQLKYVEIVFKEEKPQCVGTKIHISSKIDNKVENLEYKFIVGRGGIWNTIQEFSEKSECTWNPEMEGDYIVMVQARDKDGKKPIDYLAKEDYIIINKEVIDNECKDTTIEKYEKDNKHIAEEVNYKNDIYGNEKVLQLRKIENCDYKDMPFKEVVNNIGDNRAFFEISKVTNEEKRTLEGVDDMAKKEAIYEEIVEKDNEENTYSKSEDVILKSQNIIKKISIDKEEMIVGEKCSIKVETNITQSFLYRFYIKRYKDWDIVRDYTADSILRYTANEAGEKEFLIQCKSVESNEKFDDYTTIKLNVKALEKVEIINFKSLSKDLICGERVEFSVDVDCKDKKMLYKFYKIFKDGKSTCIQDYSTQSNVSYIEKEEGQYRMLCLVKDILSNSEYDDRAVLVYNVKPYRDVKIKGFSADLNSPQVNGTEIKFKVKVEGGKKLIYKYKIKGSIEEDTGFSNDSQYVWNPKETGDYEVIVFVKDRSFNGEFEATKKIDFSIEKRGSKPVKILDVVVDKDKKIITGETVNIMVNAEGGTHLNYSFIVKKDNKMIEKLDYNKSNWMDFIPKEIGEYEIEIMIKDKYSNKTYDAHTFIYLKSMEYLPGEIDYIIMPYKETHLVGDTIEFECIIQDTNSVLVKYETKINGHSIEETEFSKNKKLRFVPKIAGKYTIGVYSKNIKCKGQYDSKKEVSLYVSEAAPVINTKIITNKLKGKVNEELTFEVISRGGKEVCYEFYLMENSEWKKVQSYSRKHYYSFIPFVEGNYKILALAKSYYKKVNYEDYDEITFEVKGIAK